MGRHAGVRRSASALERCDGVLKIRFHQLFGEQGQQKLLGFSVLNET